MAKAKPKKVGHLYMEVFSDESVQVDVDCPNADIIAALAALIAGNDSASLLFRKAFLVAFMHDLEEDTPKKKSTKKK